jgi:Na+/H+ antiporter NhaC
MTPESSWLSLIPAGVAILTAVLSRRPIESLLAGVFAGLLLLGPGSAVVNFSSILLKVMMDETIAWVIIVCGLMGSLIALLMRVGAADAFSNTLASRAKDARSSLLYTWCLGLVIFIDDYLNALAVGSAMRKVTDKFRVSREMLAYVVDSTAAPICVRHGSLHQFHSLHALRLDSGPDGATGCHRSHTTFGHDENCRGPGSRKWQSLT